MIPSYKINFLLWQFIALADTGKYDSITVAEVKKHINAETISSYLVDKFNLKPGFLEVADWIELSQEWASTANAVDEERKMGIRNKGIGLLLAYALESYQTRVSKEKE